METLQFELASVKEIVGKPANDPIGEKKVAPKRKKSFIDGKAFDFDFIFSPFFSNKSPFLIQQFNKWTMMKPTQNMLSIMLCMQRTV